MRDSVEIVIWRDDADMDVIATVNGIEDLDDGRFDVDIDEWADCEGIAVKLTDEEIQRAAEKYLVQIGISL